MHVIDASEGDPAERFEEIDRELREYGAGLAERPQVVVLNKIDLMPEAPQLRAGRPAGRAGVRALVLRPARASSASGGRSSRSALPLRRPSTTPTGSPSSSSTARSRTRGGRFGSSAPTAASGSSAVLRERRSSSGRFARRARSGATRSRSQARRSSSGDTVTGILGGIFDPPHNGHVALARAALERLPIDRLVVLVAAEPGHRGTVADAASRLRLAEAAFAGLPAEVVLDRQRLHGGRRSRRPLRRRAVRRRRRRGRGIPDLEGAGRGAALGAARGRNALGLPAARSRAVRRPRRLVRARLAGRSPRPRCASAWRAASRSTTSCPPRSPGRSPSSASIVARLLRDPERI